jgi:hypothetical protein
MKNMTKTATTTKTAALPLGLLKSDLEYPTMGDNLPWDQCRPERTYTLHLVKETSTGKTQWHIATLHISNAPKGRRAAAHSNSRTYSIGVDTQTTYCIGIGPHILKTVEVYLKKSNVDRMGKLTDLYTKGLEAASMIRDRRSTRAANTAARRAAYRSDLAGLGWL